MILMTMILATRNRNDNQERLTALMMLSMLKCAHAHSYFDVSCSNVVGHVADSVLVAVNGTEATESLNFEFSLL